MINHVYQLVSPKLFSIDYRELETKDRVIIRPRYLSVCHADQRYFQGKRDLAVLRKKLPMALIHEACGVVVSDSTGTFQKGQTVVMIPNTPVGKNAQILDILDYISNYILMPVVSITTCIFIGWIVKPKTVIEEVTHGGHKFGREKLYVVMIRFITPLLLTLLLLQALGLIKF